MISRTQFDSYVIEPTLHALELHSPAAVELVLGTAIQESRLTYLKQIGGGPALGVCQMEPATHDDIFDNYLNYRPELRSLVMALTVTGEADEMVTNLAYAVAMCRVHYLRVPHPLPEAGDVAGMAAYWKNFYNTPLGAGTVEEYIENWNG